jgi:hypothetical protein
MERAVEAGAPASQVAQMPSLPAPGNAEQRTSHHEQPKRGVFHVDVDAALTELEQEWAPGGYRGFGFDGGTWSAISSAGAVFIGVTPDELARKIRADWQALQ